MASNNRYSDTLRQTAAKMMRLAEALDKRKAAPLSENEKQLIRLAVLPSLDRTFAKVARDILFRATTGNSHGLDDLTLIIQDLAPSPGLGSEDDDL